MSGFPFFMFCDQRMLFYLAGLESCFWMEILFWGRYTYDVLKHYLIPYFDL